MAGTLPKRLQAILDSPSYRLAEDDLDFLESDGARAIRLALEFHRTESYLQAYGIESTVVVFGSARIPTPERGGAEHPDAKWYEEARKFAFDLSSAATHDPGCHRLVVATGGGPGIMEAANRGASDAGAPTIGFNIRLPHEQFPNPWVTPGLAFRFHYFALRKMHFLLRARALVAFPGGFGTLDEVYEAVNLVQTGTIEAIPIVLVGREYWARMFDLGYLADHGYVDHVDARFVHIVDDGAAAARHVLGVCGCGNPATP
jgi:uncharacterized protein (TIGR00730 family)